MQKQKTRAPRTPETFSTRFNRPGAHRPEEIYHGIDQEAAIKAADDLCAEHGGEVWVWNVRTGATIWSRNGARRAGK